MIPLLEEDNVTTVSSSGSAEPGATPATETSVTSLELNADNATTLGLQTYNATALNGSDLDTNSTENATETGLSESSSFLVSEGATDTPMLNATIAADLNDLVKQNKDALKDNITHDNITTSDIHNDLLTNDTHDLQTIETDNDLMNISTSDNVIIDIEELTTEQDTSYTATTDGIEEDEVRNVTESLKYNNTEEIRSEVATEEIEVTSNEFENLETNYEKRHELARSRSLKLEEVDSPVCHNEFCVCSSWFCRSRRTDSSDIVLF